MLQKVIIRLADMGYMVSDDDTAALTFLIGKTEEHIKNYCNIEEVPAELEHAEIDAVAAEFLSNMAMYGGLDGTAIKLSKVTSVTEGDTSVSYADDGVNTVNAWCETSRRVLELDMLPFRRLRW